MTDKGIRRNVVMNNHQVKLLPADQFLRNEKKYKTCTRTGGDNDYCSSLSSNN